MNEEDFGRKIAQHLDRANDALPAATVSALAQARRNALAQTSPGFQFSWRWAAPALALALLAGVVINRSLDEFINAEHRLEAELLHHPLPPHAFSDEGFEQWLKSQPKP